MTAKTIHEIDKTRRLKLTAGQKFWHYFLAIGFVAVGLISFYLFLELKYDENYSRARTGNQILGSVIFWISLALVVFIIKKRRLRFRQIDVSLSENEFKEKMQLIAEKENWTLSNNNRRFAIFHNGSMWTWGLKMTILRFENYILANSICDLDSRPTVSILNENERYIKKLERDLKKARG
ncbi:MAG TPA: hypothetical protein DEF18_06135 [Muricauda sp.]|nr:hypothetical protein [uncultured Allomuricauda sp.]HBU77664.1 hypothetical protein [Allomuricauda sp.]|tara:strand:- start:2357 stop:2896 length:540 start_codon:yes stop_codon:yes gene_type:complete